MKNNLENLRLYVCASDPQVNKLLRNNQDASKLTFDNCSRQVQKLKLCLEY